MALINRISKLVTADFHAVLDQIEEPEQLLKQAIRDMEDDLAEAEQRINVCAHDQEALANRKDELESTISGIDEQLDLCFESDREELARKLIRKRLEAERLLKRLKTQFSANEKYLEEQRTTLDENRATLDGLRQKAELFAHRVPAHSGGTSEIDDMALMTREMIVGDDEVEIAFLREKSKRCES
jgi:phage shock protein A